MNNAHKTKEKKQRKELTKKLIKFLGSPKHSEEIELVAIGAKPLVQVPLAYAPKVIEKLSKLEIDANVIPKSKLWSTLPLKFNILLLEILLLNFYMASKINLWFGFLGLSVVGIIGFIALKISNKPLLNNLSSLSKLPKATEMLVTNTFATLDSKSIKTLLSDIVKTTQELEIEDRSQKLLSLIERSCEVAGSLDKYEKTIQRLEGHQGISQNEKAISKATKTKNILSQRLLETLGTLLNLNTQNATEADTKLGNITQELEEELESQYQAEKELEQLVFG